MSNKIFIADYANKVVREKATMEKPFCHYTKERQIIGCNELGGQYGSHKPCICKPYNDHLASLKSYPATWLTPEMDGKELVDGKDFELKKEKLRTDEIETPFGTIYDDIFGDTIAIALPSQPEQNREQEEKKGSADLLTMSEETKNHLEFIRDNIDNYMTAISQAKADLVYEIMLSVESRKFYQIVKQGVQALKLSSAAPTPVSSEEGKENIKKIAEAISSLIAANATSGRNDDRSITLTHDDLTRVSMSIATCQPASWQSLSSESSGAVELLWEEVGEILTGMYKNKPEFPADKVAMLKSKFHLTRKQ